MDFQINKKIAEEVASIPTKRMRNKIAGFVTHLMRRIQHRPVRGISLKLQEEERERRMDFVPERSELSVDVIPVDMETKEMLEYVDASCCGHCSCRRRALKINIPNLTLEEPQTTPPLATSRIGNRLIGRL